MYSATVDDVSCNDVSCTVQTVYDYFFEFGNPKVTVHKAKGHSTYMCGNYSREETIQGWKLYEEIRYRRIKPTRWYSVQLGATRCYSKVDIEE